MGSASPLCRPFVSKPLGGRREATSSETGPPGRRCRRPTGGNAPSSRAAHGRGSSGRRGDPRPSVIRSVARFGPFGLVRARASELAGRIPTSSSLAHDDLANRSRVTYLFQIAYGSLHNPVSSDLQDGSILVPQHSRPVAFDRQDVSREALTIGQDQVLRRSHMVGTSRSNQITTTNDVEVGASSHPNHPSFRLSLRTTHTRK